jgi:hypothetical protein
MDLDIVEPAGLLEAWQDATRAAELADRLAAVALKAGEGADRSAIGTEDIASLAEAAAEAAERAARSAREAATRARDVAGELGDVDLAPADQGVVDARPVQAEARDRSRPIESITPAPRGQPNSEPTGG